MTAAPAGGIAVGVVIPTHERPEMLVRALAGVLGQTAPAADVVVVHDRPQVPDDVPHPDRVRHLCTGGQLGASTARNLGAAAVAGTHLAFLNDDDEWRPGYLAACIDRLTEPGVAMTVAEVEDIRGDRRRPGCRVPVDLTVARALAENTGITGSSIVVERAVFESVGGFDEALRAANDLDLLVRLLDVGARYVVVPGLLVGYHEHDGPRLTTSPGRAEGLGTFRAKWAERLTGADLRRIEAELVGIRRRTARSPITKAALVARESWLLGWRESLRRAQDRRRWSAP